MHIGDLVKYKAYHKNLCQLVGLVIEVRQISSGPRVRVMWNDRRATADIWDWVEDLEVISESR